MQFIPDFNQITADISDCTNHDVEQALSKDKCSIDDLYALLSPTASSYLPQMAQKSRAITQLRFGNTTQIYAPVYLSNYCTNKCLYCGFSTGNKIKRRCLSIDEAEQEALILAQKGFSHILLVSGEADKIMGTDYLEEITIRLRKQFAAISIEVQPLSAVDYTRLFKAGVTAVAVYQETYDRNLYKKLHTLGNKTDFDYRLDTPTRVGTGGMREIGIGALLGLSDWRTEGASIGHHLAWLRKKFWRTNFTVSFPRLRPAAGEFAPLTEVNERNLSQLIFALRIFDHDVGLVLSTREESRFRDGMLGLGPTRYSAESCTTPGGYGKPDLDGEQFSVGDDRTLPEICKIIKNKGYDPVYKDWDSTFQVNN